MGFPMLAPLKEWVVKVMEQREKTPIETAAYKNPFIIMTSAALVTKGSAKQNAIETEEELKARIVAGPGPGDYQGCIMTNRSNDLAFTYVTGKTRVGVDFTGKPIEVDGEEGRKVSVPIIESMDLDTDGANNTLKTARVTVRCFTLKQLEMFEMFFMKPGMNVLIEYGDSGLLKAGEFNPNAGAGETITRSGEKIDSATTYKTVEEALVPKKSFDQFISDFSLYFKSDSDAIVKYLTNIQKSAGTYDLVAGKVLDYSFSINEDLTYTCTIEVSQGNQISLAIPKNPRKPTSSEAVQSNKDEWSDEDTIKQIICSDLNLEKGVFETMLADSAYNESGKPWEDHWFNFIKINEEQKDTIVSDKAFVSFYFILQILCNYTIKYTECDEQFFKIELPTYGGKKIIPVISHKNIISSSPKVIFPSARLPKIFAEKDDTKIKVGEKDQIVDGAINGFEFNTDMQEIPDEIRSQLSGEKGHPFVLADKTWDKIGDALNTFISWEVVAKAWRSNYTRIDFLNSMISTLNGASYGLFQLYYGLKEENGVPTILDYKMSGESYKENVYRFKATTIKSNVRSFSFSLEMSNLVAGRTIFNSGRLLAEAKKSLAEKETNKLELPIGAYKAVDGSLYANADGWYSINKVELKRMEDALAAAAKKEEENPKVAEKDEETTKEAENLADVIKNKAIQFYKRKNDKKSAVVLIYPDEQLIQEAITGNKEPKKKKATLSPIEITLVVDGFSGFSCGEYFNVDGIPEIYNQVGVFQITNTKHNVTPEGWTTTIEAGWRIVNK